MTTGLLFFIRTVVSATVVVIRTMGMLLLFIVIFALTTINANTVQNEIRSPWSYACQGGRCQKIEVTPDAVDSLSLEVCQLFCGEAGALWPKPTGHLSLGNYALQLNPQDVQLSGNINSISGSLFQESFNLFKTNIQNLVDSSTKFGGAGLLVHFGNRIDKSDIYITLETDESYTLYVYELPDGKLNASIDARSFFGARHALETLSQLIVFNDIRNEVQIVRDAYIVDAPVYPYRGILLDTARNFVDKKTILRTIEAMAMTKLNTFHWHITDSHSFPYESRTYPLFSKYGAYTPKKVYSEADVREIIHYGLIHGVRVLPEFDAPAHVGEGWQWVGDNATLCFKADPWNKYCVEPPCGQLNPSSDRVYEVLRGIYNDMVSDFRPDIFHMGGDEVNINCWNSSSELKQWMTSKNWSHDEAGFINLWDYFQSKAADEFTKANGNRSIPLILWTSGLTNENNIKHLDPSKYIIQIWTTAEDATIARLLQNDFRVIFSNYDAWYFDCGFGAWVGEGNNWCSPYKGWQLVYQNSPSTIVKKQGFSSKKNLILGGEAALWTEQGDSAVVDSRLWPRAAAMGERLWAEPTSSWIHAEQRMLRHRERMVQKGIYADGLQPEWCLQNQGKCYL